MTIGIRFGHNVAVVYQGGGNDFFFKDIFSAANQTHSLMILN
jgi:hypothetical protein